MRKIIAAEFMSLDAVVEAPSYPDEDPGGGFAHGGWHAPYFDDLSMNWVTENVRGAGGYLLGRGTYEIFAAHWPNAPAEQQVLAEPLNTLPKYVASTTLGEPLGWQNASLLRGDIGVAVRALKAEEGGDDPRNRQPRARPDPDRPRSDRRAAPDDRPHRARRRQAPLRRRRARPGGYASAAAR